jgi:hypothetical protein
MDSGFASRKAKNARRLPGIFCVEMQAQAQANARGAITPTQQHFP